MTDSPSSSTSNQARRSNTPMVLIVLITLAPVVFALLAYYVPALGLTPEGTTNYGTLVEPQRPLPAADKLNLHTMDGEAVDLNEFHGQWLLVTADKAECPESCVRKLFILRNSHASQGKEVKRLARVWLVLNDGEIDEDILEAYKGTHRYRADPDNLKDFLKPVTVKGSDTDAIRQPMWIIDPLGNLMMEFPPDADPLKVRDDIRTLLRNSRIG